MYQTLLLIPGQPGELLEHDSKSEAENVLRNVKEASAWHQGGEVTAIPLNYTIPVPHRIFFDIDCMTEEERNKLADSIREFISSKYNKQTQFEGKA